MRDLSPGEELVHILGGPIAARQQRVACHLEGAHHAIVMVSRQSAHTVPAPVGPPSQRMNQQRDTHPYDTTTQCSKTDTRKTALLDLPHIFTMKIIKRCCALDEAAMHLHQAAKAAAAAAVQCLLSLTVGHTKWSPCLSAGGTSFHGTTKGGAHLLRALLRWAAYRSRPLVRKASHRAYPSPEPPCMWLTAGTRRSIQSHWASSAAMSAPGADKFRGSHPSPSGMGPLAGGSSLSSSIPCAPRRYNSSSQVQIPGTRINTIKIEKIASSSSSLHAFPSSWQGLPADKLQVKGCHISYLLVDSPDPCKTQSTVGMVLSICTGPRQPEPYKILK